MKNLHLLLSAIVLAAVAPLRAANITVISIADSGPGSLRQAIADAQHNDTITFDPILIFKTITLTSGELLLDKNITITGLGTANFAISGNGLSRIFRIPAGINPTIAHLTLTGGAATNGGAIANFGLLNLHHVNLTNNTATLGGAVFTSNGVLTVTQSRFAGNSASEGGAVFVAGGSAVLTATELTGNTATLTGGGIASRATVTLDLATLAGNTAVFGGALYSTNGTATVNNSTLAGNSANAGGALYNDAGNTLHVQAASILTGNSALGGGAIFNEGTLTVAGGLIGTNNAADGAGLYNQGTLTVEFATLAGNVATRGGALFSTNGTATVNNSTLTGNSASLGGGLYNAGTLTVTGSGLLTNTANAGGAAFNTGTALVELSTLAGNSASVGGALYAGGGTATLQTSTLTGNSAFQGGALFNAAVLDIHRSTLSSNVAVGADGGAVHNDPGAQLRVVVSTLAGNSAAGAGGALRNTGSLTLAMSTLAGNSAVSGGGLANAGSATVDNTLFAGNAPANLAGTVTSQGYNLSDDASGAGSLTATGDLNNTPAGLDPLGLQNNGGPTPTIALLPGSAAIDAGGPVYTLGEPVYPPFVDQRGEPRIGCGKMDIGAFETRNPTPPVINLVGQPVVTNECPNVFADPGATAASTCGDALLIAAGGSHSLALKTDGVVVGWGNNAQGQRNIPGSLSDPTAIAAGEFHSLGLRSDGRVIGWGSNASGQTNVPASVTNAVGIAAGGFHSLAVRRDGRVTGWGDNTFGQTNVPGSVTNAVAVAAGRYHSLALLGNGTVVGWGGGTFTAAPEDGVNYGQAAVPAGLSNVVAIAAGAYHSLALRSNGLVVAWGGGTTNLSPFVDFGQAVVPAGLSNVVAVAAGGFHSLALVADGTIVAWGNNTYGQTTLPVGLPAAAAMAGGTYHSLAITRDGAVAGWGLNSNGQAVATAELLVSDLTGAIQVTTNGSLSAVGTATLTYRVSDARGSSNQVVRTVVTVDTTPPVPAVDPLPVLTNLCALTLTAPTASDACAGSITATTSDPTSFNDRGTYLVNWVYADAAGNSVTQQQTVVIERPTPPLLNCPADIVTGNSTGQCGAVVNYSLPVATPNCASATLIQVAGLPPGSLFPLGTTVNTFRVTDLDENTALCSFTVTVSDTEAPVISCPTNIITTTVAGQCQSAPISYTVPVSDNCGTFTAVTLPPSGTVFPVGTNTVTTTAWDEAGNTNVCEFLVIVRDIIGPQLTCPPSIVTNAVSAAGTAVVFPSLSATGNCTSATVTYAPPSGTVLPPGTNVVLAIAVDGSGNQSACEFTVRVRGGRTILLETAARAAELALPAAGTKDEKPVQMIVASLRGAASASLWAGDLHVFVSEGKTAFKLMRQAARGLVGLSRKSDAGLSPALLAELAREVRAASRSVASVKLEDARTGGGDPKDVTAGALALERADQTAAAGASDRAIQGDLRAWLRAVKALE